MQIFNLKNSKSMSKRQINAVVALTIFAALAINAATYCSGWALVGDIFGWALLVGGSFIVVDNKIKEGEAQ